MAEAQSALAEELMALREASEEAVARVDAAEGKMALLSSRGGPMEGDGCVCASARGTRTAASARPARRAKPSGDGPDAALRRDVSDSVYAHAWRARGMG